MIVVTAADRTFFPALKNLVGSIHYWEESVAVEVFDLGLTPPQLDDVSTWEGVSLRWAGTGPACHQRTARGWRSCPHVRELGLYAWKPVVLCEALDRHPQILWLDAGNEVRGPLAPITALLARDGHFFVQGQDLDVTAKLHRATPARLGLSKGDFVGKPSFAGGIQGYVRGSPAERLILWPLREAALDKRVIAPLGSSARSHRFDQSLLTLLAYSAAVAIEPHTELLAADPSELPDDPTRPVDTRICTARGTSRRFVEYLRRRSR